jgi:hypothetical protein
VKLEAVDLPVSPRSKRTERRLLLTLPPPGPAPVKQQAALQADLHRRLAQHLLESYRAHLAQRALELHGDGDAAAAAHLEEARAAAAAPPVVRFLAPFPGAVPAVLEAPLPGWRGREDAPAVPRHGAAARLDGAAAARPLALSDEDVLRAMPEELLDFCQAGGTSVETLRVLLGNESGHVERSSGEAAAARQESAALGELPRIFSHLRSIFGTRRSVMKLADVVRAVKEGGKETTSAADVEAQVRALAVHAPEFVAIKPWGERDATPAVWMARQFDRNAVYKRLLAVAAGRRAAANAAVAAAKVARGLPAAP